MKSNILIIAATLLFIGCNSKKDENNAAEKTISEKEVVITKEQLKNAAITSELMSEKELSATINVNGVIDVPPQNLVSISMPLGGYLKNTKLLPGMFVKKNEVIAVMED